MLNRTKLTQIRVFGGLCTVLLGQTKTCAFAAVCGNEQKDFRRQISFKLVRSDAVELLIVFL